MPSDSNKKKNQGNSSSQDGRSSTSSKTSGATGSKSNVQNQTSFIDLPPEVAQATKMLDKWREDLGELSKVFDTLGVKATQATDLTGDTEIAKLLNSLRNEIKAQDEKHLKGIKEVEEMIDELLGVQIPQQLEADVEAGINAQIDEIVKQQVAKDLEKYIPKEQREKLAKVKQELEEVQRDLHNSESRRANAELTNDDPDRNLHTIVKREDGKVSQLFPKSLGELLNLDGETCKKLLAEYGQEVSGTRQSNLNNFIPFCGVLYQVAIGQADSDNTAPYRSPTVIRHNYQGVPFL